MGKGGEFSYHTSGYLYVGLHRSQSVEKRGGVGTCNLPKVQKKKEHYTSHQIRLSPTKNLSAFAREKKGNIDSTDL